MSHDTRVCVCVRSCQLDQALFCIVLNAASLLCSQNRSDVHAGFQVGNNSSESTFPQLLGLRNANIFLFYCLCVERLRKPRLTLMNDKHLYGPAALLLPVVYIRTAAAEAAEETGGALTEENLSHNVQIWRAAFSKRTN